MLNMDLGTFECPHCGNELIERSEKTEEGGKADIHPRMQKQLERLMSALKRTDDIELPACVSLQPHAVIGHRRCCGDSSEATLCARLVALQHGRCMFGGWLA